MIKLNLLEKKKPFLLPVVLGMDLNTVNLKMLGVALIIYYVPGIANSIMFDTKTENLKAEIEQSKNENERLSTIIKKDENIKVQFEAFKGQVAKLEQRSKQVDEILKSRTNPKKVLEKIARSIPEDVWFESMSIDNKNEVEIKGGSYTPRGIGEFITNINESPYFGGTIIPKMQENKKTSLDGINTSYEYFELTGKIINYDMRTK